MSDKSKPIIVALKIAEGDLLAFYIGESEDIAAKGRGMVLYRPILIEPVTRYFNDTPIYSYETHSYFAYGSQQVSIPYSKILQNDVASEFFSLFYVKSIGDLMARQELINGAYLKYYNNQMIQEAMRETDSIFVDSNVDFVQ